MIFNPYMYKNNIRESLVVIFVLKTIDLESIDRILELKFSKHYFICLRI